MTSWLATAACWTLRAISFVAAPCCSTAEAIPEEIWRTWSITLAIDLMASTALRVSSCTAEIWLPISSVALAVWLARFLTSPATTANPLPASPARAASMVAFNASRLVWDAMSLMRATTSPMRSAAAERASTMVLVRIASSEAALEIRAASVTCRAISPMDDDSSSAAAATVWTLDVACSDAAEMAAMRSPAFPEFSACSDALLCISAAVVDAVSSRTETERSNPCASALIVCMRVSRAADWATCSLASCSTRTALALNTSTALAMAPISSVLARAGISADRSPPAMASMAAVMATIGRLIPRPMTSAAASPTNTATNPPPPADHVTRPIWLSASRASRALASM